MKTAFISLFFISAILLSSCKKENTKPASTNTGSTNSFTLVQNGVPFLAKKIVIDSTNIFKIDAYSIPNKPNNKAYRMYLRTDLQPGEYSYNQLPGGTFALIYFIQDQSFGINNGTINILSNDPVTKKMEFTFEAELVDIESNENIHVTNGKSTVYY